MRTDASKVAPPSDDKRWRIVAVAMRRHGYEPHALIETLHTVQETFGYLDNDALHYVAQSLRVPLSRVYGVATFYHFFTLRPKDARHTCVICMGTSCYIKGGKSNLEAIEQAYRVKSGEMTTDGQLYLQTARCLGSCGLAPVIVFDDKMFGKLNQVSVLKKLHGWLHDDA